MPRVVGIGSGVALLLGIASFCFGATTEPAAPVRIAVRTPDGRPAAGALVVLVPAGDSVQLVGGLGVDHDPKYHRATTAADGTAMLAAVPSPMLCVVLHPSGFASTRRLSATGATSLRLWAWGRITGRAMAGSKPATGIEIDGWMDSDRQLEPTEPELNPGLSSTTDSQGRFVLDHVPPGLVYVGENVNWKASDGHPLGGSVTRKQRVTVKPGSTVNVTIGGSGRAIRGRIVLPAALPAGGNWELGMCSAGLVLPPVPLPMPADVAASPLPQRVRWYRSFVAGPVGRNYANQVWRNRMDEQQIPLTVNADDTFSADDLPAGSYDVGVEILRKTADASGPA